MRLAIVLVLAWGSTCLIARAADAPAGRTVRSHIQPVGEIDAAERAVPWAGLVTTRAPAVLREQFRLERGAGLVIESVDPGSVAERAGLRRHDVLVSIDGQLLLLPEQFTTLLEASGDDAPLDCRILRGGVEKTVSLRQDRAAPAAGTSLLKPPESLRAIVPRKAVSAVSAVTRLPDGTLEQRDADYVVRLAGGAEPRLVVQNARGMIIFNGPIDTPAQRSLVPPEVRGRMEGLEKLVAERRDAEAASDVTGPGRVATARIGRLDIAPIQIR